MSAKKIGDVVATIRSSNGFVRYVTIGSLLEHPDNDKSKGPGFSLALDAFINLGGFQPKDGSVFCSIYHPKVRNESNAQPASRPSGVHTSRPTLDDFDDDDIPF